MDAVEPGNSVSNFSINTLTETQDRTSDRKSDNLSDISIPSCIWFPNGPVLNNGPIIKSPSLPQHVNKETPTKRQTHVLHHSHINDKSNDEDSTTDFSGFSEFETNSEAIDRERYVNDKFNEILYHVIPTFNQINILFSTVELYSQFVGALEKELHSRSSNKDNPIYHSHVNGKKCVITCRKEQTSVMLSGPGMCAWRETTFLRLSFGLFKAFSAKINNELSVRYNSTPVENRHRPCTPFPVSPIDFAQSLLDNEQDSTHQPTMSDLNRRLNVLWDISKSLQTQIGKINEAMNQLIQKAENVQKTAPVQEPVTVNQFKHTNSTQLTHSY